MKSRKLTLVILLSVIGLSLSQMGYSQSPPSREGIVDQRTFFVHQQNIFGGVSLFSTEKGLSFPLLMEWPGVIYDQWQLTAEKDDLTFHPLIDIDDTTYRIVEIVDKLGPDFHHRYVILFRVTDASVKIVDP